MWQYCEVVIPIITISGDKKVHRMTRPNLKVMSSLGLEPRGFLILITNWLSFPCHSGDGDPPQNGDYTTHCFPSEQRDAGKWNKIVFNSAYLSLLVKTWLKTSKEFILFYSFTLCRFTPDTLLRRQVSCKQKSWSVTFFISFSLRFSSASCLALLAGCLGASTRGGKPATVQREGLFWVTSVHFYTLKTRIYLAEQEDWLMSCLQTGSPFFAWKDIVGVVNIFSLYLVMWSLLS